MQKSVRGAAIAAALATLVLVNLHGSGRAQDRPTKAQPRPHGQKVQVDPGHVHVDDGDTFVITWAPNDSEIVRILGIDTPETMHTEHGIPHDQEKGPEARAFAQGAVSFSDRVELVRAPSLDPYGRTLGYFFLDGKNYSTAVVTAHLAYETVSHYGDNGFPEEAKAVQAAADAAGKPSFEPPFEFRRRMREEARGAGKN